MARVSGYDYEALGRVKKAHRFCHALAREDKDYLAVARWTASDWSTFAKRNGLNRPSIPTERLIKGMMKGAYRRNEFRSGTLGQDSFIKSAGWDQWTSDSLRDTSEEDPSVVRPREV